MPASIEPPGASPAQGSSTQGSSTQGNSTQRNTRRDFFAALVVVTLIGGLVLGKWLFQRFAPRPSEQQCSELLDRYLEHASRQRDPAVDDDDIDAARERSLAEPTRMADVRACQRELTESQVRCGLASPNVDDMERCMQ
jgi:hypothetical protein